MYLICLPVFIVSISYNGTRQVASRAIHAPCISSSSSWEGGVKTTNKHRKPAVYWAPGGGNTIITHGGKQGTTKNWTPESSWRESIPKVPLVIQCYQGEDVSKLHDIASINSILKIMDRFFLIFWGDGVNNCRYSKECQ